MQLLAKNGQSKYNGREINGHLTPTSVLYSAHFEEDSFDPLPALKLSLSYNVGWWMRCLWSEYESNESATQATCLEDDLGDVSGVCIRNNTEYVEDLKKIVATICQGANLDEDTLLEELPLDQEMQNERRPLCADFQKPD
ncbi:uncharacterized protein LOC144018083 [Festucalex cinctus]